MAKQVLSSSKTGQDTDDKLFALSDVIDEVQLHAVARHLMFMYENIVGPSSGTIVDKLTESEQLSEREVSDLKHERLDAIPLFVTHSVPPFCKRLYALDMLCPAVRAEREHDEQPSMALLPTQLLSLPLQVLLALLRT